MESIKILHCGDIHFDTPFKEGNPTYREKRKEDLKEAFGKIINMAQKEQVNALLIGGDLFDNNTVMKSTVDYIIKKFQEINHIKVFISPGNHDAYDGRSFYKVIPWPSNVHVFKDHMERVFLKEFNTYIYGIGFGNTYEDKGLLKEMRNNISVDHNTINIMVVHGEVGNKNSKYNPITLQDIGESHMNYIALGHTHEFSGILREKNTFYAYSGNPEGRGFDECGLKGVILGQVYRDHVDLSFKPICKRQYIIKNIDISKAEDYEDIGKLILKETYELEPEKNLFKINLQGETKENFILNKDILSENIKERFFYIRIEDNTTMALDYNEISEEFSLRGIYAKKLLKAIEKEEDLAKRSKLRRALKLGIDSLTEKEVKLR